MSDGESPSLLQHLWKENCLGATCQTSNSPKIKESNLDSPEIIQMDFKFNRKNLMGHSRRSLEGSLVTISQTRPQSSRPAEKAKSQTISQESSSSESYLSKVYSFFKQYSKPAVGSDETLAKSTTSSTGNLPLNHSSSTGQLAFNHSSSATRLSSKKKRTAASTGNLAYKHSPTTSSTRNLAFTTSFNSQDRVSTQSKYTLHKKEPSTNTPMVLDSVEMKMELTADLEEIAEVESVKSYIQLQYNSVESIVCKVMSEKFIDIPQTLPIPIPSSFQRGISRSLSREFECKMFTKRLEETTNSLGEHGRSHTRHIVETSRVYTRRSKEELIMSPSGIIEPSQGQINQFRLLDNIGNGSFGRVVRAFDETTQQYYACKIISKSRLLKKFRFLPGTQDEKFLRMKQEVAVLKKVSNHSKIIKLFEVLDDKEDDNLYLIFQLCEKGPVMQIQVGQVVPHFDEERARSIFRDITLGLEFLHFKGIIHCDLKPENILLTMTGEARIGDFSISMILEDAKEDSIENQNTSPLFTSPSALSCTLPCLHLTFNVASKGKIHGKPADIWALGICLYCFVHGHCPFEDDNIVSLYKKITSDRPIYRDGLSKPLRDLLDAMLHKNDSRRITIEKIKLHPWVTDNGKHPLLPTKENCPIDYLSNEEVEKIFKPATLGVRMMAGIARKISNSTSQLANRGRHGNRIISPK